MYGCLKSSRLFYEHLMKVLSRMGFILNPCDDCVANNTINSSQCTITWHVDDLKVSHKEKKVVELVTKDR